MGKQWKQWQFIFWVSKITVDGDCSHEIKRYLLLGKALINLESILKSRDITLPTKVGPYSQSYGFHSSHLQMWELDHKEGWVPNWWTVVLGKALERPLDCKQIKPVHSKGNQPWIFIGRTDAEAEAPILWPPDVKNWLTGRPWCWERLKVGGEGTTEDEMVEWHHWLNGHEFE